MTKKALITGIAGQDGSYLAKHLLNLGYEVYGADRRRSTLNNWRHAYLGIESAIRYVNFELLEPSNIFNTIKQIEPDEIYNLAAQSFVKASFEQPLYTADVDALGVVRVLEAIKILNPKIRFYQASSSEMFGKVQSVPQNEATSFYPRSPYATAKLFAHWISINYRESYDMHCSNGILFNHESPLRGEEFVTRKITNCLAKIKAGKIPYFELGNLDAQRDWGFAGDYVVGMHLMLQQTTADDYVLATGETHSVKEFIEIAAKIAGFDWVWQGQDEHTLGLDRKTGKTLLKINPQYYRPNEVDLLIGDATKAKTKLNWQAKTAFVKLVEDMMFFDLKLESAPSQFEMV